MLTVETAKEFIIYSAFGAILGMNIYWISYAIVHGVKWLIKKIKARKHKKEETPIE